MLFNSLVFIVFFAGVYAFYLLLGRRYKIQNYLLLVASYVFYGYWDYRFLALIFLSTVVDYFVGLKIHQISGKENADSRRKMYLAVSVFTNLGVLAFFKYFNFFADSAIKIFTILGLEADSISLNVILPVGISFYTFQTMSYTIDIYRRKISPTARFSDFALFVAFFPQLVAGPIERAANLLPQIRSARTITSERIHTGIYLILWGYFEKVVIADNMARVADDMFSNYMSYSGIDIVLGLVAFALQIYGDFSGYSNIARGTARLMGFDLMVNFRLPYLASNPADFWHRWHISLSTWLRDYLYISLGGNQKGSFKTNRNLLATMLLGGLWHGAAWNFVLWGAFHGAGLVVYRVFRKFIADKKFIVPRVKCLDPVIAVASISAMLAFTLYGWLLFRSSTLDQIVYLTTHMSIHSTSRTVSLLNSILPYAIPLTIVQLIQNRSKDLLILAHLRVIPRAIAYSLIGISIILFGARNATEFIYFQF